MKRKILPLMIAGISAVSAGVATADVTVYGKANVSLQKFDSENAAGVDTQDNWEMESNASRIGVKGSIDITDTVKAIYKMEYETAIDDGDVKGQTFGQRNIYGGFQGNFGTIIAGKNDTPTKLAQNNIDRFNDLAVGDIKNVFAGENRASDIIMYTTPSMGGFAATAAIMPGEDNGTPGDDENDSFADHISIALSYNVDALYLALAMDDNVAERDLVRFVAEYAFGPAKIGFMWQESESTDEDLYPMVDVEDESGYLLSGEVKVGENGAIKAQYAMNTLDNGIVEDDVTQIAIGYDHKLNKASKLFAYYASVETDYEVGGTAEDTTFGVGYEIKF